MRRKFIKPETIELISAEEYNCNNKFIKKGIMWLIYMELTDGLVINHACNGREYRLREMLQFIGMFILQIRIQIMSFSAASGTAALVSRFVTSSLQMEAPWKLDTQT